MNSKANFWEKRVAHSLQQKGWIVPVALCLLVAVLYAKALSVGFALDDYQSLFLNTSVHQFPDPRPVWVFEPMRFITYWTFSLNYAWTGQEAWSYHLINVIVHALVTWVVWWLVQLCLRAAYPTALGKENTAAVWLPLAVALLFAAHPLQTQAVTYVVQRATALAALFYLGAMATYLQVRLASSTPAMWRWGGLTLLLFFCGMLSKQIVATLPLALLLVEIVLLRPSKRRFFLASVVMLSLLAAMAALMLWLLKGQVDFALLDALTVEVTTISRLTYLATEMEVLWRYLGLTLWPAGQHLDHDVVFVSNVLEPYVLFAALAHVSLVGFAILLASGERYRLTGMGLLFFYVAHGVESSVIPIADPMFEHRMYLPMFGLALAAGSVLFPPMASTPTGTLCWQARQRGVIVWGVALCIAMLAVVTVQRNHVWQSKHELYRRDAVNARFNPRPVANYGSLLVELGQYESGLQWLRRAMQMRNGVLLPYEVTHVVYGLHQTGDLAKARRIVEVALNSGRKFTRHEKFVLLMQQGGLAFDSGELDEALPAAKAALQLYPDDVEARRLHVKIICRKAGGANCPP